MKAKVIILKMTIKDLCKVCSEYSGNLVEISILKGNIKGNKRFSHLKWAIDRDTLALNKLIDRQSEIQELILGNDTVVF